MYSSCTFHGLKEILSCWRKFSSLDAPELPVQPVTKVSSDGHFCFVCTETIWILYFKTISAHVELWSRSYLRVVFGARRSIYPIKPIQLITSSHTHLWGQDYSLTRTATDYYGLQHVLILGSTRNKLLLRHLVSTGLAGILPHTCIAPTTHATGTRHYSDIIKSTVASQITSLSIVYSTVYSDADQRNHLSSASLAFVQGIHRGPVNSEHKWPVTRKMFPFDDVIMNAKPAADCSQGRYISHAIRTEHHMGQVTKVPLSCYLVLLSFDSKTR